VIISYRTSKFYVSDEGYSVGISARYRCVRTSGWYLVTGQLRIATCAGDKTRPVRQ